MAGVDILIRDYSVHEFSVVLCLALLYLTLFSLLSLSHAIQPCPIPNGAAGLALLGKICRQAKRTERAERYFRMSLQLDPFLFTSHAALAEMGVVNLDTASIFGVQPTALQTNPSMAPPSAKTPLQPMMESAKTPLQPMMETPAPQSFHRTAQSQSQSVMRHRSVHFETPGLTPIPVNASLLPAETPPAHHYSTNNNMGPPEHPAVMRRAREVASRQYYPPSPETPSLNSVTRSMRYLRGLGTAGTDGTAGSAMHPGSAMHSSSNNNSLSSRPTDGMGRSLFAAASSENQSFNRTTFPPANSANVNTTTMDDGPEKPEADTPGVHEILEIMCVFGLSYHRLCQYRCRDALQTMQVLPQSQQTTGWVLHQQGKAYLELNDFQSARRCLESMHIHDPGRMQGLELLSTVYWQLKKEVELAHLAQKVVDWDRLSPEAWCVVGNCFSLQKDHETALVFFGRSLQLDPNFTYTHTLSGYEYMANEDFDKAISCFRQAMKTDERHYNAWYGLGAIYHRQEKFDLAEVHFERAATIHPTSSVLKCNLGIAQYANGKAYQALDTLSEAFRLDPRNPQARFQRATIYSALHRPQDALQELIKVRDAAPREATVHFAMGKVYKRLGQTEQAMKCFLTAMDLDPKENQLIKSAMDKLDEADVEDEVASF
jgi:anaphase-promoting complex subunit 3